MPPRLPRPPARVVYASRTSVQKVVSEIVKHLEDRGFSVGAPHTTDVGVGHKVHELFVTVPNEGWGALAVGARILIDPKTFTVSVEDHGEVSIRADVEAALASS